MVVSAVKDATVPDVNKWRAYAVHGGTGVLVLCLIRDVYKKQVSQALAHTYCLGVNWILHNSIYVKELSELVPALGATAQQYSEENDRLKESIDELKETQRGYQATLLEFQGLSAEERLQRRAEAEQVQRQLEANERLISEKERQVIILDAKIASLEEVSSRLDTRTNIKAQAAALHSLLQNDGSKPELASKALEIVTALN